jgi:hypothetical protein
MRVDGRTTIYCKGNPKIKVVEESVKISVKSELNQCKKLDKSFAPRDQSKPFTSA